MSPKYKVFLITLLIALGADQATKMWARASLKPRAPQSISVVDGFWEFRYAENSGAAFSLLRNQRAVPWVFDGIALIATGVIFFYMRRAAPADRLFAAGMGLLGGGAIGNLIDRVAFGRVTDFVVWRVGSHVWPTFNVADAVLLIGVLGLILQPRHRAA